MIISFGTKAETLERLSHAVKHSKILPQVRFTVNDWETNQIYCIKKISDDLSNHYKKYIVRSSAFNEDSLTQSNAGQYQSVGNIDFADEKSIINAVNSVIGSYGKDSLPENQVFIQPFLENVLISGVVFTRDIDTLSPYYILDYDDKSKTTDSITSGSTNESKTLIKFHDYPTREKKFQRLFVAIEEIEQLLNCDYLDIEFAIDTKQDIYIFQVRPIVHSYREIPEKKEIGHFLNKIYKKVKKINKSYPYLHGKRTILGVMPDWNPAEIIGIKPRPLALSLYKYLVTDRTWAYQRNNYGYRNLRSFPLLISFLGMPYIDVRVSFNSFIPKQIKDNLASKLMDFYLESLMKNRDLHDKVEFEILFSCYFLDIHERCEELKTNGFSPEEINLLKQSLLDLTNEIIAKENSVFHNDLKKIEHLKERQSKVIDSSLSVIEKIYWLVEDCCRYGTLPFAGLARAGFIAVQMLKSFVNRNIISENDFEKFMLSLNTVAKQMKHDHVNLSINDFLEKYGHLRPGTYDILSARYDEAYDLYFGNNSDKIIVQNDFSFNNDTLEKLDNVLKTEGIKVDAVSMIEFIKKAIEGREYAKFVFTRSLSEVLSLIKRLALKYGLSVDDASFMNINSILNLYATLDHRDLSKILKEEVERNKCFYETTRIIKLPPVILNPEEIYEYELKEGIPNFITLNRCKGHIVKENELLKQQLSNKIVLISSADPGYDWIFSKNIAGIITMYGGANSHMAIRSAELKIPAVIGAGEKNFNLWRNAEIIEINGENRQVKILR